MWLVHISVTPAPQHVSLFFLFYAYPPPPPPHTHTHTHTHNLSGDEILVWAKAPTCGEDQRMVPDKASVPWIECCRWFIHHTSNFFSIFFFSMCNFFWPYRMNDSYYSVHVCVSVLCMCVLYVWLLYQAFHTVSSYHVMLPVYCWCIIHYYVQWDSLVLRVLRHGFGVCF